MKETILTKIGILKRTKKPTNKPSDSPIKTTTQELVVESVEPTAVKPSNHVSSKSGPKKVRKLQFTKKGVLVREVSCHGSPTSKKLRALNVAQ